MIGFETIGNATVTVFDDKPLLSTDPWIYGNPYFGSWGHKYTIPSEQLDNIKNSKFIFLSHGHPDHVDPESFKLFENKTLLIGDHYGDRMYNDLKEKYNCIKLKSNSWFEISKNIRIKSFADWNQDCSILIEILKKDIILNLNDGKARGWSKTIKNIIKPYKNRFLLELVNEADADMINFYDHHDTFLAPKTSPNGIGKIYNDAINKWNCNYAIPFSCFHKYIRKDTIKMNKFVTPLESHYKNFDSKYGELLPAFIKWDSQKEDYVKINPKENIKEIKEPEYFGDSWSEELDTVEKDELFNYFKKFDHLKKNFGFIIFKIGNKEYSLKLSSRKEGIVFEAPRNSLIFSIKNDIFDDILIGNFMKTQLINVKSLVPDFSPYVTKYGDNGDARTQKELKNYFNYYRLNSANYWTDYLRIKSVQAIRSSLNDYKNLYKFAKFVKKKVF